MKKYTQGSIQPPTAKEKREFAELQTFQDILAIARRLPFDVDNKNDLLQAFSAHSINLTKAIQSGKVEFKDDASKAELHALLAVCYQLVMKADSQHKTSVH